VDQLIRGIEDKKAELDRLRLRVPGGGLSNFEHVQDLDLTYTSNAIEGNTLTAAETTLVVEKGITIGGKRLLRSDLHKPASLLLEAQAGSC
jgi:Fic family protein